MISQQKIDCWYDDGQKKFKMSSQPSPQENKWIKFLVYGKKINPSLLDKLFHND